MTTPPLQQLLRTRTSLSWLILMSATLVSWAIGTEHGTSSLAALVVLAIAAAKIRLVGLDFMELRHAPTLLRAAFEFYCIGLWTLLAGLYLWL